MVELSAEYVARELAKGVAVRRTLNPQAQRISEIIQTLFEKTAAAPDSTAQESRVGHRDGRAEGLIGRLVVAQRHGLHLPDHSRGQANSCRAVRRSLIQSQS